MRGCPREKIAWIPGSNSPDQCLTYNQHKALLRDISPQPADAAKLSEAGWCPGTAADWGHLCEPNAYVDGKRVPRSEMNILTAF